jgi:hypothetical protein
MAAKQETIRIRLVGTGITPASVSVSTMAKTVEAVQALVHGTKAEGESNTLQLLQVKPGSAIYICQSDNAGEAAENVLNLSALIAGEVKAHVGMETLSPLKRLSRIAKSKNCQIQLMIQG